MPITSAQKRATDNYRSKFKQVRVLLPPDVAAAIESCEPSKNAYILRLIRADLTARGLLIEDIGQDKRE